MKHGLMGCRHSDNLRHQKTSPTFVASRHPETCLIGRCEKKAFKQSFDTSDKNVPFMHGVHGKGHRQARFARTKHAGKLMVVRSRALSYFKLTDRVYPTPMTDQKPQQDGRKKPEEKSFWKTIPGILTGIAAVVTAVATLLAAADKAGLFASDTPRPSTTTQKIDTGGDVTTSGDNSPIVQDVDGDVSITGGQ